MWGQAGGLRVTWAHGGPKPTLLEAPVPFHCGGFIPGELGVDPFATRGAHASTLSREDPRVLDYLSSYLFNKFPPHTTHGVGENTILLPLKAWEGCSIPVW